MFDPVKRRFKVTVERVNQPTRYETFGANKHSDIQGAYLAACEFVRGVPEPIVRTKLPSGVKISNEKIKGEFKDVLVINRGLYAKRASAWIVLGEAGTYTQTYFNERLMMAVDLLKQFDETIRTSRGVVNIKKLIT